MERKRTRDEGFVGLQLSPDLLKKLDDRVKKLKLDTGSGNRSQVVRMAIIEYLKQHESQKNLQNLQFK